MVINEYDLLLQEKEAARVTLANPQSSAEALEEAKSIIKFNPIKEVYTLQAQTDNALRKSGFSDTQIQNIRVFDGTVDTLRGAFANLEISATNKCTKNASGYWAKVAMSFYWDGSPIVQKRDAMVASASTGFMAEQVADTKAHVNYVASYNSSYKKTVNFSGKDMVINPFGNGNIAGFGFDFDQGTYYAVSGTAVLVFLSPNTNRVSLSFGYGHASAQITPSVGISFANDGLSVGLSFGLSETYKVVGKAFPAQTIS